MRRYTAVLLVLGGICLLAGLLLTAYCIYCVFDKNIVYQGQVQAGRTVLSGLAIDTRKMVLLSLEMEIETPSLEKTYDGHRDEEYAPRFQFPLHYTISGADGEMLFSEDTVVDNSSMREGGYKTVSAGLGRVGGEFSFAKHPLAESPVTIELLIEEDSRFDARAENMQLRVYDNVLAYTPYVLSAVALLVLGTLLLCVGVVASLIQRTAGSQQDVAAPVTDDHGMAAAVHLSAYAGFLLPFGGVLGPLIVWLVGRGKSAFVDDQGAEAVNFRLSLLIYYVISGALVLLLIGFILLLLLFIFDVALTLIAGIQASKGIRFRYPLTIRFIKPSVNSLTAQ